MCLHICDSNNIAACKPSLGVLGCMIRLRLCVRNIKFVTLCGGMLEVEREGDPEYGFAKHEKVLRLGHCYRTIGYLLRQNDSCVNSDR